MSFKQIYYPESCFGEFTNVDGTVAFYTRVNALIQPSNVIVDVGCGRGSFRDDPIEFRRELRNLKGKCREVIGIDVDNRAKENPFIDEFRLITEAHWPVEDQSTDVCVSDNVLEHIEDPEHFFSEITRILKPGGYVCIRTPNVLSYFGLISKLVPNRQHSFVLGKVKDLVNSGDIFPTVYRCNTIAHLRKILKEYNFVHSVYGYDAEPSYLSRSRFFYFLGVLHQRYAPHVFKVGIHAFGRKL